MARHQYAVDDSEWFEVVIINGYAVFMGYLMMGVRGLGVLVFTWTTVVLLGGFVSDVRNKDFWCLTGITLVQTAGVFNFLLKEKLSDMVRSWLGLWFITSASAAAKAEREAESEDSIQVIMAFIISMIQALVIGIILCLIGVLYMLGLYISAGISLWRLIEHDFGNEGGANMKPSLQVLYSLAVAQGMLFGYKTIYALGRRKRLLAKFVADELFTMDDEELVAEYLEETVAGCQNNPSFATGRNLVTYGVNLMMEATSNEGFIAGIRVLAGAIKDYDASGRIVLAKHLLTRSNSWGRIIQRLLQIVGPRSPYSREVRAHAARIVALVARGIRLEQFPGMIECISSLLDTSSESNQQEGGQLDIEHRCYGDKLKDYQRLDLLEKYELDYLEEYYCESPDSPGFPLIIRIEPLVQCLSRKRKTMENEWKGRRREDTVHGFDRLLTEAVNIIHQLVFDDDNRTRIMSNAVLQHKIAMAPLKLHRNNHDSCHASQKSDLQMLEKCWVLIKEWPMPAVKETSRQEQILEEGQPAAPSDGGRRSREEIQEGEDKKRLLQSSMVGSTFENSAVISNIKSTIKSIFDCLDCGATQKRQGIQILLHLSLDMSFIMDGESRTRRLTWILLLIFRTLGDENWMIYGFTDRTKNRYNSFDIRRLASEKLADMLREKHEIPLEESARQLQLILLTLQDLTSAFADDAEDISIRTHAAIIMEGLCVSYNPYDDFAEEVKGILVDVILPKVVKEILIRCAPTRKERSAAQATDVEKGVSEYDVLEGRIFQDDYMGNERFRKALVSLCRGGYMKEYSLEIKFMEIASKICKEQKKSFKYFRSLLV